jgi:imidazolonepropionase-like amidohydrolase
MQRLTAGLRDAGVPLLAGTDPFVPCVIPGFSFQEELEQLYGAGLTNYEVLQTATVNAARFLGESETVGTVAPGKRADLVLVNANPLDDIGNAFRREGVMLRGKWMTEDVLQKELKVAARRSIKTRGD